MTNFVVGKIGLPIRFNWLDYKSNFFSPADDISRLIVNLSFNNPSDSFYIIGKNDIDELSLSYRTKLFPHNNVFNTFNKDWESPIKYLNDNKINIDCGVIGLGPVLSFNIPNKSYTKSGTIAKPLDSAIKYSASYINTLNELNVKWISIIDDPRHINHTAKDLNNKPIDNLSQVQKDNIKYSCVEIMSCLDEKINFIDESWRDRTKKISIVLNQAGTDESLKKTSRLGNGHRPRYPILKSWILDFTDVSVYGKWTDEIVKSNKSFKGSINRIKLYSEMMNWKHSLCVPIDKGWATAKYLECLKCGISPFMHPEYDDQKNTNVQDFYRVGSVEEFKDKVMMNDDTHIKEINKGIKNCLSDEYISGQRINDGIYSALDIERNIKNKVRDLWTPQKYNTLEEFFS